MALTILSTLPVSGDNSTTIDSNIVINFNQAIDPFTVENGISLYYINDSGEYSFVPCEFNILDNRLTLTPSTLKADTKHYLSVLPGNDPARYLSALTITEPEYTRVGSSDGILKPTSYFNGTANVTYTLVIEANNTVSVTKGLTFIGSTSYIQGEEISIDGVDFRFILDGQFETDDVISVNCFKATGVDAIYKVEFSTTKYTTITPGSVSITDDDIDELEAENTLYIVDSIPENLSVDNLNCNPIILKFNKNIKQTQDIKSKIHIKKSDLQGNKKKIVDYDFTVTGSTVKLYLKSVGNPT